MLPLPINSPVPGWYLKLPLSIRTVMQGRCCTGQPLRHGDDNTVRPPYNASIYYSPVPLLNPVLLECHNDDVNGRGIVVIWNADSFHTWGSHLIASGQLWSTLCLWICRSLASSMPKWWAISCFTTFSISMITSVLSLHIASIGLWNMVILSGGTSP